MLCSLQQGAPSTGLCRAVAAGKAGWPTEVPRTEPLQPWLWVSSVVWPCGEAGLCLHRLARAGPRPASWEQGCHSGAILKSVEKFQGLRGGEGSCGEEGVKGEAVVSQRKSPQPPGVSEGALGQCRVWVRTEAAAAHPRPLEAECGICTGGRQKSPRLHTP